MFDNQRLRGEIVGKYHSISTFAESVSWNKHKAYRIVNGTQNPDLSDIHTIVKALGLKDANEVNVLFNFI